MTREEALWFQATRAIEAQRAAAAKRDAGALAYVADDPDCPDVLRLAALMEELGEVARAIHDDARGALADELAQLAGIALAWMVAVSQPLEVSVS